MLLLSVLPDVFGKSEMYRNPYPFAQRSGKTSTYPQATKPYLENTTPFKVCQGQALQGTTLLLKASLADLKMCCAFSSVIGRTMISNL
jgi:hypothetical protein